MNKNRMQQLVLSLCVLAAWLVTPAAFAATITINVVDQDGTAVAGFRWLVQEDATIPVEPGVSLPNAASPDSYPLSMDFHTSYHPLGRSTSGAALSGNTDTGQATVLDVPDGRYFVSVLPYADHGNSGMPVEITGGASETVTIVAQRHPIPTAQIAIYLFHDNAPVNGAPDLPEETNPAPGTAGYVDWSQFSLFLEEPAGRYGIAGGQVIRDAFNNPIGTSYLKVCDANGAPDLDPLTNYGCFDADGAPIVTELGDGTVHPNPDGTLLVENLAPGKYGIVIIPPTNSNWQQTSTIEGTKVIDAWVKANEPPFFVEFGPPGPHVFVGFIKSSANGGFPPLQPPNFGEDTATVSGLVTDMHLSRPPATELFSGRPFPNCWIALNDMTVGIGRGIYAAPCNDDSTFAIPDVPPGNYQIKVFDANLDVVIASLPVTVDPTGGTCNMGQSCDFGTLPGTAPIAVFNWFARLNTGVFSDNNQNGFWDDGEAGIGPESQDITLRWRDGTIYQNFPTDGDGLAPFDEVFPFFHWLVAEISFANKKATGATFVVDAGGFVDTSTDAFPGFGELNPQPQCVPGVGYNPLTGTCPPGSEATNLNTGDNLSRTETGPVLTTGFQGFLGQTSVMQFGKADYLAFTPPDFTTFPPTLPQFVGENGGISGIVFYAVTRAEDEPQFAAAEEWEPGIPRVQVNMYADGDIDSFPLGDWPTGDGDIDWNGDGVLDPDDGIIDDVNRDGVVTLADVDRPPLGNFPADEDTDHNLNGTFDLGDALQVAYTDSWDDNKPEGCQGETFTFRQFAADGSVLSEHPTDCFDGLRNFNQIRPAVFDGGYAFADYDMDHLASVPAGIAGTTPADQVQAFYDHVQGIVSAATWETLQLGILPGEYIIEANAPVGYEHIKEEDRNVDFGDNYIPSAQALAVACVGDERPVPPYFSMATKDGSGALDQLIPGIDAGDAAAPFAGDSRPLCDRKKVQLSSAQNAAVEFFMMTDVPVAANVSGVMLNDLANEFDPNSPVFGEKYAPPWLPVGFYDFNGNQVNRVHGDQFGRFDAVLPSTYTTNLPQPSGMSPNMLIACMNDAGPIDDGTGNLIVDPYFDPQYSQFCYTFQYMPGTITYLDTPVVPIAAFAGPGRFPLDCERPTSTPIIASVTRSAGDGPFVVDGDSILIDSMGTQQVPNPEWNGISFADRLIGRDYGFGSTAGSVVLLDANNAVVATLTIGAWSNDQIEATVAGVVPGDYQVAVIDANGAESPIGVTLTVGEVGDTVARVAAGQSIQEAIDAASPGDLILVGPGVYNELVIMWKPVRLQGWGAGAVSINARQAPTEKIAAWRQTARLRTSTGQIGQLPGQQVGIPAFPALDEIVFPTEEGAGIFVGGRRPQGNSCNGANAANFRCTGSRIDGFLIIGASTGGGIVANGYNEGLVISNNRLNANAGFYGGGIRVGHPTVSHAITTTNDPDYTGRPNGEVGDIVYDDAHNDNIRIHHNHIAQNGGFGGAGGGISLHTGADGYSVERNWVCGNFSQGDGAGIGHLGLSDNGLIADNTIIFNESFSQMQPTSGGGIFIGGQAPLQPEVETGRLLSPGAGDVLVDSNLLRGNLAGGGDGGGVALASVNGHDVVAINNRNQWYAIQLHDNMITNNVSGMAGGALSIRDSLRVEIRHDTIANNDSTATAGLAFAAGSPNQSTAQVAGIASHVHSAEFGNLLVNDINPAQLGNPVSRSRQTWPVFSDPDIVDSIVLHNRSFYWMNDATACAAISTTGYCLLPDSATPDFDDLAVMDGLVRTGNTLNPVYSMLTDTTGYDASNVESTAATVHGDFGNGYFNVGRDQTINFAESTVLQTAGAFDEGGNWLQVSYGPLSLLEPGAAADPADNITQFDYHLAGGSAAIDAATPGLREDDLVTDYDGEPRPDLATGAADIGADEVQ